MTHPPAAPRRADGPVTADRLDAGPSAQDLWDLDDPLCEAGLDDRVHARLDPLIHGDRMPARVARIEYGGLHLVTADGRREAVARLPRTGGPDDDRGDTPLAVGDWVACEVDKKGERLLVVEVSPRARRVGRRDPSRELAEQVLAANVETLLIVCALDRPLRPGRIERSLVLAAEGGVDAIVVMTKADLADPAAVAEVRASTPPSTPVVGISVRSGDGMDELADRLPRGATSALIGESGAGKSSLVNALVGSDVLATRNVRGTDSKGRHTTTSRELVPLGGGTCLLDTPGTRELGVVRDTGGLDAAFEDVVDLAVACRFGDCRHEGEAGCAVARAVEDGDLTANRVRSFVELRAEIEELDQKRVERDQRAGEGRRPRG